MRESVGDGAATTQRVGPHHQQEGGAVGKPQYPPFFGAWQHLGDVRLGPGRQAQQRDPTDHQQQGAGNDEEMAAAQHRSEALQVDQCRQQQGARAHIEHIQFGEVLVRVRRRGQGHDRYRRGQPNASADGESDHAHQPEFGMVVTEELAADRQGNAQDCKAAIVKTTRKLRTEQHGQKGGRQLDGQQ
ncbi:hypothetical protein D3C80_1243390 [compost metagenome]